MAAQGHACIQNISESKSIHFSGMIATSGLRLKAKMNLCNSSAFKMQPCTADQEGFDPPPKKSSTELTFEGTNQ